MAIQTTGTGSVCICLLSTQGWLYYINMVLEGPCDARWCYHCSGNAKSPSNAKWISITAEHAALLIPLGIKIYTTVEFKSICQSRITGVPDVSKYGSCHGSWGPTDDRVENVTKIVLKMPKIHQKIPVGVLIVRNQAMMQEMILISTAWMICSLKMSGKHELWENPIRFHSTQIDLRKTSYTIRC